MRLQPQAKVERRGKVTIVKFSGAVISEADNALAYELEGHTQGADQGQLFLDFTNVERLTSLELGTLLGLHKRLSACGGQLILFNLNAVVYEILVVTRLNKLLAVCREEDSLTGAAF